MKTLFRSALLVAVLAGAACADPILLTFTGPGIGVAGASVTLLATATNTTGADLPLDALGLTLISPFVDYDDSAFFTQWPLQLDASGPGSEYGPAAIFSVLIPLGTPAGLYSGNVVNVLGSGNLLTSQTFDIEVAAQAVPEPATGMLLATAMLMIAAVRTRRSR